MIQKNYRMKKMYHGVDMNDAMGAAAPFALTLL